MPRPPLPYVALLASILAACAPETNQPVRVMALVRSAGDGQTPRGEYVAKEVQLRTLTDVVALKGSVANLVGGARIVVDPQDPMLAAASGPLTDEQLSRVFIKTAGADPVANYIEKNGVLWPADFHTWNMVTSYFDLEQAHDYFGAMEVPEEALAGVRVFYFPSLVLKELGPNEITDNALFFSPVKSFMILPFDALQKAPLAINQGVMAHEYSHLVFNRRVYGGEAFPKTLSHWAALGATEAPNLLKAIDEGLADYHAFGTLCRSESGCDTNSFADSLGAAVALERDFSRDDQCMSADLRGRLENQDIGTFTARGDHYRVGTALAAALYQAGKSLDAHETLAKAVLAAYDDPAGGGLRQLLADDHLETPQVFTLEAVGDVILRHIPDGRLREEACSQFLDRLRMERSKLPSCPSSAANPGACPNP